MSDALYQIANCPVDDPGQVGLVPIIRLLRYHLVEAESCCAMLNRLYPKYRHWPQIVEASMPPRPANSPVRGT